jgi:hypothetical protein
MASAGEPEPLIYREEVLSILWALADIVVGVNKICSLLEEDGEEEEEQEGDL